MRRLVSQFFLVVALLIPLLTACPSQSKDELKPVLTLTGEAARTVNTNSVLIEGTLQDNVRVASFSYSLNGGQVTDVMSSLQGNSFKFVVKGLISGKNFISLVATDFSGNKSELISTIEVELTTADPTFGNPKITLSDGNYYQIATDHLILEGTVVDDDGVALFTYTLNSNAASDITSSLKEGKFSIELTSLKKGFNDVYFNATDSLGNKTELKVEIATQFVAAPDIAGLWGQQNIVYKVCGRQEEMALTFNFDKPGLDGKIIGTSVQQNFSGKRTGQVSGYVTSPENFWLEFSYGDGLTMQMSMALQKGQLLGQVRMDKVSWCYGSSGDDIAFPNVVLDKDVDLPAPPPDIAFEPNNRRDQAKEIANNTMLSLLTPYDDQEWFTIKLSERSLLDFSFTSEGGEILKDKRVEVYERASTNARVFPASNKIVLEAGSYYLHWEYGGLYTLTLTTQTLQDTSYKSNNSRATAKRIDEGLRGDFVIDEVEKEDWFTFTLSETRVVTVDFGKMITTFAIVDIVADNQDPNSSNDFFTNSMVKILPAGTYYLFVGDKYGLLGGAKPYSFSFSTVPLVDKAYEPNNTKDEATLLTNGFSAIMFLGGGDYCDIFSFTLNQPKFITLDLGSEKFKYYSSYNDSPYWDEYSYEGIPLRGVYGALTHHIKICLGGLSNNYPDVNRTYPVRFTVE
jgi:hypothetical protein